MILNNVTIQFDMDDRKDNIRFIKAYEIISRKIQKNTLNTDDMETFLVSCLHKEQIDTILADNKISTLTKVFAEFFNQAVTQYSEIVKTYDEVYALTNDTYNKANEINAKNTANMKAIKSDNLGSSQA